MWKKSDFIHNHSNKNVRSITLYKRNHSKLITKICIVEIYQNVHSIQKIYIMHISACMYLLKVEFSWKKWLEKSRQKWLYSNHSNKTVKPSKRTPYN